MTDNEKQIRYAMEHRLSVEPERVDGASLRAAGCLDRVFVLPEQFNERVSYLGDVLVQMLTRKPQDDRLRATVGQLCQALTYMLNSASWREGELFDFDAYELRKKLGRFVTERKRRAWEVPIVDGNRIDYDALDDPSRYEWLDVREVLPDDPADIDELITAAKHSLSAWILLRDSMDNRDCESVTQRINELRKALEPKE